MSLSHSYHEWIMTEWYSYSHDIANLPSSAKVGYFHFHWTVNELQHLSTACIWNALSCHCHEQLSWTHSFLWLTAPVQCHQSSKSRIYYSGSHPSQKQQSKPELDLAQTYQETELICNKLLLWGSGGGGRSSNLPTCRIHSVVNIHRDLSRDPADRPFCRRLNLRYRLYLRLVSSNCVWVFVFWICVEFSWRYVEWYTRRETTLVVAVKSLLLCCDNNLSSSHVFTICLPQKGNKVHAQCLYFVLCAPASESLDAPLFCSCLPEWDLFSILCVSLFAFIQYVPERLCSANINQLFTTSCL